MKTADNHYKKIYLFVVGEDINGFAEMSYAYQRNTSVSLPDAIAEIKESSALDQPPTSDWQPKPDHSASGLNMTFPDATTALVFVRLPHPSGPNVTEFGARAVKDLDVASANPGNIVRRAQRHKMEKNREYLLCSFQLDIEDSLNTIGRSTGGHRISQLPIMFDFVDTKDRKSPVFKDPHKHFDGSDAQYEAEVTDGMGHGGIHPPSASSFILVD